MNDFLDLQGASGASYRFRIWPHGEAHVPTAGNYVFVSGTQADPVVVLAGVSEDLSAVRDGFGKATTRGATHVFTRLNVARSVRLAEHEDIVASYRPPMVGREG
jgi:hypothetical protein